MQLVIAEKPSVARDLARVLGVRPSGDGTCFEGAAHVITWCIGHLVELDEPASYDARWKAWRLDTLPMIPDTFKLRGVRSARGQLSAVRGLLRERRFDEVVNACDAGREGELIFRYVYDLAGSRLPIRRLWISSLTDEAIRQGFASLRRGEELQPLADAARCRSEADWLVGLNATRAVTVRHRTGENSPLYSIGRVQTPTLAILVEREKAIRAFRPRDYWEVRGTFQTAGGGKLVAGWTHGKQTRFGVRAVADQVLERAGAHAAAADAHGPTVESVRQKKAREPAPLLFDLTSLQRTANRRFGFSASRTLDIAQALYERHKLLTYPRTDARHLSSDMAAELPKLFRGLSALDDYAPFVAPLLAEPPRPSRRVFDDAKVGDHHAIIPTGKTGGVDRLDRDERRIFDLVARRFLAIFHPDAEFAETQIVVRVGPGDAPPPPEKREGEPTEETMLEAAPPPPDRFSARGRVRLVAGWQAVAGIGDKEDDAAAPLLPAVSEREKLDGRFEVVAKQTKPPPRHNEATLLSAMEYAGRTIEDESLRDAMKDAGLGTPATRASIIETLLKRGFAAREGKNLAPTDTGIALIDALPVASLASPQLTGEWEARLARIARGAETRAAFMTDIARYVADLVDAVRRSPPNPTMAQAVPGQRPGRGGGRARRPPPRRSAAASPAATSRPAAPSPPSPNAALAPIPCPRCKQGTLIAGKRGWGCSRWREACPFVVWFETAGHRLSESTLRDLVTKGKTRKAKWGRLILDLAADQKSGAARLER